MNNSPIIIAGKTLSSLFKTLNLGNGSTWPGHLALKTNPHFIQDILKSSHAKIIIIAGTNGKTTTSLLIKTLLEKNGKTVFHNQSGANLMNGIASSLLLNAQLTGKINTDYVIFEVDENALPQMLKEVTPDYLALLNLFRDQLDRYGEVRTIAEKWKVAFSHLGKQTKFILNADDPEIAHLGKNMSATYFSLPSMSTRVKDEYATDSTYCPNCGTKLTYKSVSFSHLGDWECKNCNEKRPVVSLTNSSLYPLSGKYNEYNTNAAVLLAQEIGLSGQQIESALKQVHPAFGRQEIIQHKGKKIQLFLSKNPTGFNESLRTAISLGAHNYLFVLNDRIPDGKDVSWIWDTDIENILNFKENITVSGDRVYDMGLRMKYAFPNSSKSIFSIQPNIEQAIKIALHNTPQKETLAILPTYSAMLDVRQILTGKKIL